MAYKTIKVLNRDDILLLLIVNFAIWSFLSTKKWKYLILIVLLSPKNIVNYYKNYTRCILVFTTFNRLSGLLSLDAQLFAMLDLATLARKVLRLSLSEILLKHEFRQLSLFFLFFLRSLTDKVLFISIQYDEIKLINTAIR